MRIYLFLIFACFAVSLSARQNVVRGYVCDTNGNPIEYANISILNMADSSLVIGEATEAGGRFALKISEGKYILKFHSIGYNPEFWNITVSDSLNLGKCILKADALLLDEIVVSEVRPAIKRNATGMTVSVSGIKYLQNKTLDKILALSPGVFIDNTGTISINGNSGVTIIFNDRTIRLTGDQLVSYLKSIQGTDLKDIEIMTNPTSAYDAEGTGGVIKINVRRKKKAGLSGYLSGNYTYDRRSSYRPAGGLSLTVGEFTFYCNYNYLTGKDVLNRYTEDNYKSGQRNILSEIYYGSVNTHNYTVGVDWDINSKHYFGFEYNGMKKGRTDKGNLLSKSYFEDLYTSSIDGLNNSKYKQDNNMFNFNYVWRIDTLGQVLKLTADYSDITGRDNVDNYHNKYYDANDFIINELKKQQLSKENAYIYSAKLDYEKIWKRGIWKLNAGVKYSVVRNNYSYNMLSWKNKMDEPEENPMFKDKFRYTENISAGYANASYNHKHIEANLGIRGEHERTEGKSFVSGVNNVNYDFHLFPSVFLYWKPCKVSGFMAYYGIRISRPPYQLVNPFTCYLSDLMIKKGNPNLKSEIVNSVELTYVLQEKYYVSVRSEFRKNKISDLSYTDGKYTIITSTNFSGYENYYLNAYVPYRLGIWNGNFMLNAGLLKTEAKGESRRTLSMNANWDNIFYISDNLSGQLKIFYMPPYKDVYMTSHRHTVKIDANVDFSFYKDKWLLSLGCDDILNSTRKKSFFSIYPDLTQNGTTYGMSSGRTLFVGLKYNFSTSKKSRKRQKTTSISEELNRL